MGISPCVSNKKWPHDIVGASRGAKMEDLSAGIVEDSGDEGSEYWQGGAKAFSPKSGKMRKFG